jgi:hypothetical protein
MPFLDALPEGVYRPVKAVGNAKAKKNKKGK